MENASFSISQNVLNASYPWDNELQGWSQCLIRDVIGTINNTIIEKEINTIIDGNGTEVNGTSHCKQFVYDRSKYKSTTTSEVHSDNLCYIT